MTDGLNPQWERHFNAIGNELVRLSIACDVDLSKPGVVERVIKNDASVCGRKNEIGFEKLHNLVIATFNSLGKSIDRIGADETKKITDAINAHMQQMRDGDYGAKT